jgi:hypothetical protein
VITAATCTRAPVSNIRTKPGRVVVLMEQAQLCILTVVANAKHLAASGADLVATGRLAYLRLAGQTHVASHADALSGSSQLDWLVVSPGLFVKTVSWISLLSDSVRDAVGRARRSVTMDYANVSCGLCLRNNLRNCGAMRCIRCRQVALDRSRRMAHHVSSGQASTLRTWHIFHRGQ